MLKNASCHNFLEDKKTEKENTGIQYFRWKMSEFWTLRTMWAILDEHKKLESFIDILMLHVTNMSAFIFYIYVVLCILLNLAMIECFAW